MNGQDEELARLRASVNCATILERLGTEWTLDKPESTRGALKFRRGPGEIVIVNHDGRGWFDPMSNAKGDIFSLVQHLEPMLNFGQVRQRLRKVAGIAFTYSETADRPRREAKAAPPAERWAARRPLRRGSAVWRYLTEERCLPETVLKVAAAADAVREGPYASAWFAHRDHGGTLTCIEMRGPSYRGMRSAGIRLYYPSVHPLPDGVKEGILLEVGFDQVAPNRPCLVSSWAYDRAAAAGIVGLVDNRATDVPCYEPGYTLVEKLQTISTKYRRYAEDGSLPQNFLRHYYDVYCLLGDAGVQNFIGSSDYVAHKDARFPAADN